MAPEDLKIHAPSGLVLTQQLPYRSGPLAITRHDNTLLIEAMAPDTELSVHPTPEGIVLRIEATRYTLALAKTEMLHIRTGAGDDNVFVESTLDSRIVIETGEGNDRIRIEGQLPPDGRPLNAGSVLIDAGAGDDHVVVEGVRQAEIDGGKGNDALHSAAAHSTLYAGAGDDVVRVNAGNATIEAFAGHNRLSTGPLDDRLYGNASSILVEDGFSAPLLYEAHDAQLPAQYLDTFDIQGDPAYTDKVRRQLVMLRASPSASGLLEQLVAHKVKVAITPIPELDNAYAGFDPAQGDPTIRNGMRGDRILNCKIGYNPLAHRRDAPSLVMLYHELCHVWNFATGSVNDNAERLAVGLENPGSLFDFDDDPSTPDTDTNPAPFNENALRHELGLPPRLTYP